VATGLIVEGSLQPRILDNSISFSIALTNIRPGTPPLFTPTEIVGPFTLGILNAFTADGSKVIAGEIPEPMSLVLATIVGASAVAFVTRRRRNKPDKDFSRQI